MINSSVKVLMIQLANKFGRVKLLTFLMACLFAVVTISFTLIKQYGHQYYVQYHKVGSGQRVEQDLSWLITSSGWNLDTFKTEDGLTLTGVIKTPVGINKDSPWLLYFHSNGPIAYKDFKAFYDTYLEAGWGFAGWSYRGYGMSEGVSTIATIRHDAALMAERVLKLNGLDHHQLRIAGFSLGQAAASFAAMHLSREKKPPAAVLLMATGYRPSFPHSLIFDGMAEVAIRREINSPLLITHGLNDKSHSVRAAFDEFMALNRSNAQFIVVPAGHFHLGYGNMKSIVQQFLSGDTNL